MPRHIFRIVFFVCTFCLCTSNLLAASGAWDLNFPVPSDNPLWQEVSALWENHWDGENIDDLIDVLHRIEKSSRDMLAVNLWLSRVYYLKSRYQRKGRTDALKRSEAYAAKALSIDENNMTAIKMLITAVLSYADFDYIKERYGASLIKKLPAPVGRAIPELDDIPEFKAALSDWDRRDNIERGKKAVAVFKTVADKNPGNLVAQLWATCGYYYLGYYYLSIGRYDTARPFFEQGNEYGLKALAIDSHNVPANYWRMLNLARLIQNSNIIVKARYLYTIMGHLVLAANENTTYFYCGPLISTATIIEKGGWVAEKGLGLAGYTIETVTQGLELAVIAYPTYFYTHFARAEVLYHNGKKKEAKSVLENILKMDPYCNPYHGPENVCVQRLARNFLKKNFTEK